MLISKSCSNRLVVLFICAGTAASPSFGGIPHAPFEVRVASGADDAAFRILSEWGAYDPTAKRWTWTAPRAIDLSVGGDRLGCFNAFSAAILDDPELQYSFESQAGPNGATFHIGSSLMEVEPALENSTGWGYVGLTLSDIHGDGAWIENGVFLLQYNGWAGAPGGPQGTTFGECLFDSIEIGPYETITISCGVPPAPIAEDVESMSLLMSLEVGPYDAISGTGTFVIVACRGDLDGDLAVTTSDLAVLSAHYGMTEGAQWTDGDLDADGDVDLEDLAALLSVYGDTCE